MTRDSTDHLSDEEFVAFVLDDCPPDDAESIDRHLEECDDCLRELEEYYDAVDDFPSQQWDGERRQFAARLQTRRRAKALRPATFRLMAHAGFRVAAQAKAEAGSVWEEGTAEDGGLWWTVEQDRDGGLTIRAGAPAPADEGTRLRLRAGPVVREAAWAPIPEAPDQVGAVFQLSCDDRAALPPNTPLQLEIVVDNPAGPLDGGGKEAAQD
ncbi:MAG TPA: hypothetical protein VMS17_23685 [Gemmataceae bacterium]|nr:hypothetical protein [Gemmataceae bacterium]